MDYSNNSFQKGIVIFVGIALLIMCNTIETSSSFGHYEILSSALIANIKVKDCTMKKIKQTSGARNIFINNIINNLALVISFTFSKPPYLYYHTYTPFGYEKHDFSEFDN